MDVRVIEEKKPLPSPLDGGFPSTHTFYLGSDMGTVYIFLKAS
jgi:hypothetical protein